MAFFSKTGELMPDRQRKRDRFLELSVSHWLQFWLTVILLVLISGGDGFLDRASKPIARLMLTSNPARCAL